MVPLGNYSFDNSREPLFYEAIRQYYPKLKDGALQPGYTGIRPKISGPKEPAADFMIQGPRAHGVPGKKSKGKNKNKGGRPGKRERAFKKAVKGRR